MKMMAGTTSEPLEVLRPKRRPETAKPSPSWGATCGRHWRPMPTSIAAAGTTRWPPRICTSRPGRLILDDLGLDQEGHTVIFCSPRRAELLQARPRADELPHRAQPGDRPVPGSAGGGCRTACAARGRALPARRRDGPAGLSQAGHLGQRGRTNSRPVHRPSLTSLPWPGRCS